MPISFRPVEDGDGAVPARQPISFRVADAPRTQQQQDSWGKSVLKDVARPFGRLGVNVMKIGQAVIPGGAKGTPTTKLNEERGVFQKYKGTNTLLGWFGDLEPVGTKGTFGEKLKDSLGTGLEVASYMPFTRGAVGVTRAGLRGAIGKGAKIGLVEGGVGGAMWGAGRELQDPKSSALSVGGEALKFGALGAGFGLALGSALPLAPATYHFIRNKPGYKAAVRTMQHVIRVNPTDAAKFERMAKESIGEYAVRRGIYGNADEIAEQLARRWVDARDVGDSALAKLKGRFQALPIKTALKELAESETRVSAPGALSPDFNTVQNLVKRYEAGGLDMSEINLLKRLYERNVRLEYVKANAGESVRRSTNIDSALRKWQYAAAKHLGLENLPVIRKETQLAKELADAFGKTMRRQGMNNRISLTDWIILAGGDPTAVAGFIVKRVFGNRGVQSSIARRLGGPAVVPPPSAYIRPYHDPQRLIENRIPLGGPNRGSGISVVPAKKMSYRDPKTGKFVRGYTTEGQTTQQLLQQTQTKKMLSSTSIPSKGKTTEIAVTSFRGKPVKKVVDTLPYYETTRARGFEKRLKKSSSEFGIAVNNVKHVAGSWEGSIEPSFAVVVRGSKDAKLAYAAQNAKKMNQDAVIAFTKGKGNGAKYTFSGVSDPDKTLAMLHKNGVSGATVVGNEIWVYDIDGSLAGLVDAFSKEIGITPTKKTGKVELIFKDKYDTYIQRGRGNRNSVYPKTSQAGTKAGVIPKSLESEAIKYSTPDEFIKSRGKIAYHTTNFASEIEANGFKIDRSTKQNSPFYGDDFVDGVYFTTNKSAVSEGGVFDFGGSVIEVVLPKNLKLAKFNGKELEDFVEFRLGRRRLPPNETYHEETVRLTTEELKKMGYDGIRMDGADGEVVIFNPSKIKLRQELENIWHIANKK